MNLRLFLAHTQPELAQTDKGLEQDTPIRLDSCGELVKKSHSH